MSDWWEAQLARWRRAATRLLTPAAQPELIECRDADLQAYVAEALLEAAGEIDNLQNELCMAERKAVTLSDLEDIEDLPGSALEFLRTAERAGLTNMDYETLIARIEKGER